eukprot:c4473_g1_i2.p1 GENE.c4473_g1_i2~~c4473_g1_i2.p1  ORF type:complete len:140 (+),score=31.82 c4473_g1_i2:444-863(+)
MLTPNGRFAPNRRICMSMSDFHPETWNPMWSVASILSGLMSFMLEREPTTGCVETNAAEKRQLAAASLVYNTTGEHSKIYNSLFGHIEELQRYHAQVHSGLSTPIPGQSVVQTRHMDKASVLWLALAVVIIAAVLWHIP